MAKKDREMRERLESERDKLRRQIEALQNQLVGIERSIALISGEALTDDAMARPRTRNVKETVLGLLAEVGEKGLSVLQLLEMAQSKGKHLDRGSVSSLLSRLKREHILDMADGIYRVKNPSAAVVNLHAQTH